MINIPDHHAKSTRSSYLKMLFLVPEDGSQERQQGIQLGRCTLCVVAIVGYLDDLLDHVQHERACVKVHIELLEKLENVSPWLIDQSTKSVTQPKDGHSNTITLVNPPVEDSGKLARPLSISNSSALRVCADCQENSTRHYNTDDPKGTNRSTSMLRVLFGPSEIW